MIMSTSYLLLLGLVVFLILFIYFVFFSVSLRLEKNQNKAEKGIYLRDDHCDWGSSGMNEFTNEFGGDK